MDTILSTVLYSDFIGSPASLKEIFSIEDTLRRSLNRFNTSRQLLGVMDGQVARQTYELDQFQIGLRILSTYRHSFGSLGRRNPFAGILHKLS